MSASSVLDFVAVARLAAPEDNVAVAICQIDPGTTIRLAGGDVTLVYTVLEGHRFAVRRISTGEALRSWGLPFGWAVTDIASGDYVCNQSMLDALKVRVLGIALPVRPNFQDRLEPFQLAPDTFSPGRPVERVEHPRTFMGYRRPGRRGVGTRNILVILGTNARTAAVARQLAARLQPLARVHPGIDGIVAIAHTEGGGPEQPNNLPEILRALAGFVVHPNVAAVLALDFGAEPVSNARLEGFLREQGYPLDEVTHAFQTLSGSFAAGLDAAERTVRGWLPAANACVRTPEPVSALRVALQCGGSDAFSGISGNPLAGSLVHEVIRHGGAANLCETDELVGAEAYLLRNVRDLATAQMLLAKIASFEERLSWHGVTAEANPSAGNKLRGLYNISLKSLGAVHKKDPRTRIEAVIDYAQPMREPGFHFMNSPGNDLEGIAGQVAAGCNLVLFITGNGSITNFPFVPTLKLTTTTRRHTLLQHEMDINAGRYLDGETMEALTAENFDFLLETASGRRSKGEHAGHSQVSLWRNWRQTDRSHLAGLLQRKEPDGRPLITADTVGAVPRPGEEFSFPAYSLSHDRWAVERVGLVLPTSLCATQIARLAAERLNVSGAGRAYGVARFTALVHTEGCGFGGESMLRLLHRIYRGYATHPNVAATLLLEHGCEKVPNDVMRRQFEAAGIPLERFGWASVQLDGGIEKALGRVEGWFAAALASRLVPSPEQAGLGVLSVGFQTSARVGDSTAEAFAALARLIIVAGGSVLLPASDPLLRLPAFADDLLGGHPLRATLAYGQPRQQAGLHVVDTESSDWSENLAGLGGCGAHLFVTAIGGHVHEGHSLVPVLQFAEAGDLERPMDDDLDGVLPDDTQAALEVMMQRLLQVAGRAYVPASTRLGLAHFQLTRGLLGVST